MSTGCGAGSPVEALLARSRADGSDPYSLADVAAALIAEDGEPSAADYAWAGQALSLSWSDESAGT